MQLGFFGKYLTLWVALCIVAGVAIGELMPSFPDTLSKFTVSQVSIPVGILIWFMIYPMMVRIDFTSIIDVRKRPRGLALTLVINWLVKPFTMFVVAWFFLKVLFAPWIDGDLGSEYVAGAILLGAAPCTAMVFVWSYLTKGNAAYTLVQVTVNDLVLLFAYAPIVILLLGIGDISVPYDTVLLSVILYVVIPLAAGYISRKWLISTKGDDWFEETFLPKLGPITIVGLLLTLVLLFSFQGEIILDNQNFLCFTHVLSPSCVFSSTAFTRGNSRQNAFPWGSLGTTYTLAPWTSAIRLTMASPRPDPRILPFSS